MSEERCENCRFYNSHPPFDEERSYQGWCRRFPPVIVEKASLYEDETREASHFPDVCHDDWCGEYQPAAAYRHPLDVAPDPTTVALKLANATAPEDRTILSALYDLSVAARNRRLASQGVTP